MRLVTKRIIVVGDDDPHNAMISTLLTQYNPALQVECWGNDAVIGALPFADLLLLDPILPCKTLQLDIFLKTFTAIRRVPTLAATPAVAMSVVEPAILIPALREVGYRGFLRKPVNYTHFASQITDILDGKQVWEYR
jgi:CheY-like chemotaxis protein